MSNKQLIEDRKQLQDRIRAAHGKILPVKEKELCRSCGWAYLLHVYKGCCYSLLPVTLEGVDCPYYHASR